MNRLLLALAVLLGLAGPALAQQGIRQYPQIPVGTMIPTASCMYVNLLSSGVWSNASLCPTSGIEWAQAFGIAPIISVGSGLALNATTGQLTATGGGGGGTLTLTDGTHTVTPTTQITVSGATVGGVSPNATLTVTGSITGSGTAGTIPIWSTSSSLANSPLLVSAGSVVSSDPVALPVGSAAATSINFGTAGTGYYQSGSGLFSAVAGAQAQSLGVGTRQLYGNGIETFDRLQRLDIPTTGAVMSVLEADALNSTPVNKAYGAIGFVPQVTTAGAETGDVDFFATISGTSTLIAGASGLLSAFKIYPGKSLNMAGLTIIDSSLNAMNLHSVQNNGAYSGGVGSAAATTYNFGTPGTGLFGSSASVRAAIAGVDTFDIAAGEAVLSGSGAEDIVDLIRTDQPTLNTAMSALNGQGLNSASANANFGSLGFVPEDLTAGAEYGAIQLYASISGVNTLIATADGQLSAFNIGAGHGIDMAGTQIITSARVAQLLTGLQSTGAITFSSVGTGAVCATSGLLSGAASCPLVPAIGSGATYTVLSGNAGQLILLTHGTATTGTLAQSTGPLGIGFGTDLFTEGAGTTLTVSGSALNNASTIALGNYQDLAIAADGAGNYVGAASLPWPATQNNTLILCDDMVWRATCAGLAGLGAVQTWTAAQTFTNSDLKLLGSSTGVTTFTSANAGASNYTLTIPAATDTIGELGQVQTWSAVNTFSSGIATPSISGTGTNLTITPATNGNTVFVGGANTNVLIGQNSNAGYNGISLNGTQTFASMVGFVGGLTGAVNLIEEVPSTGFVQFDVAGSTKVSIGATEIVPVDNTIALGDGTHRFSDLRVVLANATTATGGYVCYTVSGGVVNYDNTNTCLVSSMRFKHDIRSLADADALAEVMAMRPVSYRYNEGVGQGPGYVQIGQIAEDVNKIDPRLVAYDADGKTPRAIKYEEEIPLLIGAIKAQQAEIEQLKARMH